MADSNEIDRESPKWLGAYFYAEGRRDAEGWGNQIAFADWFCTNVPPHAMGGMVNYYRDWLATNPDLWDDSEPLV